MSSEIQEITENDRIEQLATILEQLTTDQVRFIVARQDCSTDKQAADEIGISVETVYHWAPIVKEAVRLMALDGLIVAQHIRRRALAKAMLVKAGGLDSIREGIQQRVATEIIEWEMGKAAQPVEGNIIVEYTGNINPEEL